MIFTHSLLCLLIKNLFQKPFQQDNLNINMKKLQFSITFTSTRYLFLTCNRVKSFQMLNMFGNAFDLILIDFLV